MSSVAQVSKRHRSGVGGGGGGNDGKSHGQESPTERRSQHPPTGRLEDVEAARDEAIIGMPFNAAARSSSRTPSEAVCTLSQTFPRRLKNKKTRSTLGLPARQLVLRLKRNPSLLPIVIMALLLLGLIIFLWFSFLFQAVLEQTMPSLGDPPFFKSTMTNQRQNNQKTTTALLVQPPKSIIFMAGGETLSSSQTAFDTKIIRPDTNLHQYQIKKMKRFSSTADYGGLHIRFFAENHTQRDIFLDPEEGETRTVIKGKTKEEEEDESEDTYYAFDDDYVRGIDVAYNHEGKLDPKKRCRKTADHRLNFQTCNSVHELDFVDNKARYLAAGAYRQVFSIHHEVADTEEKCVIKDLHYKNEVEYDNFEFIRMDAIVAERLSSNPRTFDIYGFCALSILSEFFSHGNAEELNNESSDTRISIEELKRKDDVDPQNPLTAIQKLVLALEMAEGLAALHGYKNGLIVHDDVQPSQFLFNEDKSMLKLNDFNRAEFMLWDDENQEYCRYTNGRGHGNWRSPEEYKDDPLDEKIDVWSYGVNVYYLLTGLEPFFNLHHKEAPVRTKKGETSFLDPRYRTRSKAENHLASIVDDCWKYKPADRPSMFEIVRRLTEAVSECLGEGETRANVIQSIKTTL